MATFLDVSQQAMVWRQLLLDDLKAALELKEHGVDVQFLVDNIKRKHRCLNYLFQQWTGEDEFFIVQHLFEDGGLDVEESSSFEKIDPFSTIELHEYAALLMEEMANDGFVQEQGDLVPVYDDHTGEATVDYKHYGDLEPGDRVFGPDGEPVKVTNTYAQGEINSDVQLDDHLIEDESFDNEDETQERTGDEENHNAQEDHDDDFEDDGLSGFADSDITRETEETDGEPLAPSEPVLETNEVTDEQVDEQPLETGSSGIKSFDMDSFYEGVSSDTLSGLLEPYVDNSVPVHNEVVVEEISSFEVNDETEEEQSFEGEQEETTDELGNETDTSESEDTADLMSTDENYDDDDDDFEDQLEKQLSEQMDEELPETTLSDEEMGQFDNDDDEEGGSVE